MPLIAAEGHCPCWGRFDSGRASLYIPAAMPVLRFIEPCLPSPADRPPSGANWIHEIKHDPPRQ